PYSPAVTSSSGADPCPRPPDSPTAQRFAAAAAQTLALGPLTALQPSGEQQQRRRPLQTPPYSPTSHGEQQQRRRPLRSHSHSPTAQRSAPYSSAVSSSSGAGTYARPPTALQLSGDQQQRRRPLRAPSYSPTAQQ
ncbi:hypothetical protein B484DRAFT_402571, partial [Ochromonadaceae sp. CCMP2298]